MRKIAFVFTLLVMILGSCTGDKVLFEEYYKLPNMSWNRFNIVTFEIPVNEEGFEADFYLNIRHIPEIPYETLKYNFTFIFPSGEVRTADYELDFLDNGGNALSECMGDLCDLQVPVRKNLRVSDGGMLKVEIENKYTKIEMPGIIEVGLIVRKSQDEL
ncbi:MAG: gliding motility lipoprotein GldH [Bacteroidetes bacterium]|nr:gliding motility lipoprotein GldH [Bacteroidota bacterium]